MPRRTEEQLNAQMDREISRLEKAWRRLLRAVLTMTTARRRIKSIAGRLSDTQQARQQADEQAREERRERNREGKRLCEHGNCREACIMCAAEEQTGRADPCL